MRTSLLLLTVVAVGCGSRTLVGADGGPGDAPAPARDGASDGSPLDGPVVDGPAATPCAQGGGTCVPLSPGACQGQIVGLSCGPNQLACCLPGDGGAPANPCQAAGGTCVPVYPGSCTNGSVVSLSCGPGVGTECCMPGDGGLQSCLPSGGCSDGPRCGATCCHSGERCDPATETCRCGSNAACGAGDVCASAGPGPLGGCGMICCGASSPCPL